MMKCKNCGHQIAKGPIGPGPFYYMHISPLWGFLKRSSYDCAVKGCSCNHPEPA